MTTERRKVEVSTAVVVEIGSRNRRIDPRQSRPRSLAPAPGDDAPLLSWVLHALTAQGIHDITYVGDYHIEKVIDRYPDLRVRYLAPGEASGEVAALLRTRPSPGQPLLVVRGATVVLPEAMAALPEDAFVTTTYSHGGQSRSAGIIRMGGEFVEQALHIAHALVDQAPRASLDDLTHRLEQLGHQPTNVPLDGLAAHADDRGGVMRTIFKGKGATLDSLAPLSKTASVAARERFSVQRWREAPADVLAGLADSFRTGRVVVRSSTRTEDGLEASHAGVFLSRADVDPQDEHALRDAIDAVIASYAVNGRTIDPSDEVLVQEQIRALRASGVLLTRDPASNAPYFVINLESSGRSDVVTSGGAGIDAHYALWGANTAHIGKHGLREVVALAREMIALSGTDALDLEWGLDADGGCHLFQVRPLAENVVAAPVADEDVFGLVDDGAQFVRERMRARPGLAGDTTLLGTMPDWNPAEILGPAPRPLALSLYQHLLGDEAWAQARAQAGYRDVRPESLVISIGGRPYVDVRASLNSLLPAGLDEQIAHRWVNACLERLRAEPQLHDKIEFELALTSLSPGWEQRRSALDDAGLTSPESEEFEARLRDLTLRMIVGADDSQLSLSRSLEELGRRRDRLMANGDKEVHSLARRLRHLLEDCRRFGVVPFAVLARSAFVGLDFLRGFRNLGILSDTEYEQFLLGVPTVASELSTMTARLARGELQLAELLDQFGHLRPNSYEITSPSYREEPQRYFSSTTMTPSAEPASAGDPISLLRDHGQAIRTVLASLGLDVGVGGLGEFMKQSIAGRERAKFEFMKSVDAALHTLADLGEQLGLDRDELSFTNIAELVRLDRDSVSDGLRSHLARAVNVNEKQWLVARALRLPDLIRQPEDLYAFQLDEWRPNFVTRQRVVGPAVWLDDTPDDPGRLSGRIAIIRAADPGYDWIFGQGIAGLITEYGGAASHMAIRAGEFGLPAAIGCGQRVLDRLRPFDVIELDCEMERVEGLR